jgi:hypothetical protein
VGLEVGGGVGGRGWGWRLGGWGRGGGTGCESATSPKQPIQGTNIALPIPLLECVACTCLGPQILLPPAQLLHAAYLNSSADHVGVLPGLDRHMCNLFHPHSVSTDHCTLHYWHRDWVLVERHKLRYIYQ